MKCQSPFCIVQGGIRGREFEPVDTQNPLTSKWCPGCIKLQYQTRYIAHATADMIRQTYEEYRVNELPKDTRLVLEQFATDLIKQLGESI